MKFGIELPQLTGHGDWCSKIQVPIFFKIFFGLNYQSVTRFRHSNFNIFGTCKKFFAQRVGKPNPGSQRPFMAADWNQLETKKYETTVDALIIVVLTLIQANPLQPWLLPVLVLRCYTRSVILAIQKINLKNNWYLNFLQLTSHLTTDSYMIIFMVSKDTCKIQVPTPILIDFKQFAY